VKSEYTGIVAEVYVNEWVRVGRGAPLARLDTREAEVIIQKAQAAVEMAKAALLQAQVASDRAEREYARALKMKEVGLVTQQQGRRRHGPDAAAAQIRAAQAQQTAAEEDVRHARTRLDKARIRSPLDGVVAMRGVNVGDLAGEMGSPKLMFQIVDNRLLDLTVTVPSTEMERIRLGQELVFTTDALPGRTFTGKVMFINPSVSEADRSVKVVAEVRNVPEVLKGGLFVKGRIVTGERTSVLRVRGRPGELERRRENRLGLRGERRHRRVPGRAHRHAGGGLGGGDFGPPPRRARDHPGCLQRQGRRSAGHRAGDRRVRCFFPIYPSSARSSPRS
jgi:RND family efflux transporter MFP subunit